MRQARIIKEDRDIAPYVVEVCRNSIGSFMPEQCFKTKKEAEEYLKSNLSDYEYEGYKERKAND